MASPAQPDEAGLPEPQVAREWLETMTLIRRFEERAGEMYARAKVGGFLHLSIGEEATIVGSARALRANDYLVSTYRSHGHALVRGTPPEKVMPELFGRIDGCGRGVPGMRCDGMDVLDTHAVLSWAVERVRAERRPVLVEAITYRFRGHSMADPEQYRTKEEVAQWRARDPIPAFGELLVRQGLLDERQREEIDAEAIARVDAAVQFAEGSPFPQPDSLYDDVYVLDHARWGTYSVKTTDPEAHPVPAEAQAAAPSADGADQIPQQMTDALRRGEEAS